MDRRKKRPARASPAKESARRMPLSWVLVGAVLAGMALFAVSSHLVRNRRLERFRMRPPPSLSLAAGGKMYGTNARSSTNTSEATDLDLAADRNNQGTELLARGKIDEA